MSRFESSARKLFPLRSRNFTASVLILLFERGRSMVIRLEMARMKDDRSDDQFIKNALRYNRVNGPSAETRRFA
jgi:hypothetical protein